MQLTRELPANIHLIRSYTADAVRVGERVLRTSCLIGAAELLDAWSPHTVAELTMDHFRPAFEWRPEIVLLGTGTRQQFPPQAIYAAIMARGIGFEVMDTGAACRTYNVLVSENRRAVLGLIFPA